MNLEINFIGILIANVLSENPLAINFTNSYHKTSFWPLIILLIQSFVYPYLAIKFELISSCDYWNKFCCCKTKYSKDFKRYDTENGNYKKFFFIVNLLN